MDTYAIKARYTPAIATIIPPIVLFNYFYASPELADMLGDIMGIEFLSNLTISGVCLYYLSQFGRFTGKELFENWYFREESYMPTTNFLMAKDSTFSQEYKQKFGEKVARDFNFNLPSAIEQTADEGQARRRIVEIMALIRKKMGKNAFLLQHNIEYGAMRNAIGGALIGVVLCLLNILFFWLVVPVQFAIVVNSVMFLMYATLVLLSKIIITSFGRGYAKVLFREYMGS